MKICDQVVKTNNLTLKCNKNTEIIRFDVPYFPKLTFQFEPLASVDHRHKNETIDVIAICQEYGPVVEVKLSSSVQGQKRELVLIDRTSKVFCYIFH